METTIEQDQESLYLKMAKAAHKAAYDKARSILEPAMREAATMSDISSYRYLNDAERSAQEAAFEEAEYFVGSGSDCHKIARNAYMAVNYDLNRIISF